MELYGVPKNPLFLERIPRFPMTTDQKVWGSNPYGCTSFIKFYQKAWGSPEGTPMEESLKVY